MLPSALGVSPLQVTVAQGRLETLSSQGKFSTATTGISSQLSRIDAVRMMHDGCVHTAMFTLFIRKNTNRKMQVSFQKVDDCWDEY